MPELRSRERLEVLLVCSSGGHLLQLVALRDAWRDRRRLWVTDDAADTRSILRNEPAVFGDPPSSRSIRALIRSSMRAARLIRRHRPYTILTTGSAIAVPYAWIGRVFGAEVIYVESITRVETPSLTLRLLRPATTSIYVQWPELATRVRGARFAGTVLPRR